VTDDTDLRSRLFEVLRTMFSDLRASTDPLKSMDAVAEAMVKLTDADFGMVTLMNPDRMSGTTVGVARVPPNMRPPSTLSVIREYRNKPLPTSAPDALRLTSFDDVPDDIKENIKLFGIGEVITCTIVLRGDVVGFLNALKSVGSAPFPPGTEEAMTEFSSFVAITVDNIKSSLQLRKTVHETAKMIETAPIGILLVDTKGIIRSINQNLVKIFGRKTEEELVGTSVFEIASVNRSGMDTLIIHGMDGHASEKTDLHLVIAPDRAYYLHVKVSPLTKESGEPEGAVLVAMDTSSKVRLENQLERSYEKLTQTFQELERVTKMKSQFIDVVSHELRTPLTVMRGYVDMVESEYSHKLDPKFAQKLKIIKANTDKLYGLVESMLDVSRLEKGSMQIHPEPLKVDTVLEEIVKSRMKDAQEKNQTLTLGIEGSIPLLMADRRRIRDVFNHVIDNAVKYTQEEGRIHVGVRDEGKMVHVWVKDNGVGIPLENLGRIFDRFYIVASNDLAHPVDRIGLSLPISKGIVEAHGGRIWVESQVGKGSVFHVELPKEPPR
jgi:PAS domain S-box-containing protein